MIMGTAYVENRTLKLKSKLFMALISPMQPTWNRSSICSPRPEKRCMTLSTRRRFSLMKISRASSSPSLIFLSSSVLRS